MARRRNGTDPPEPPPETAGREGALAVYVRWRLKMLGMTPTELGERAGIGRSTAYGLLRTPSPALVSTDVLHKIAQALEADPRIIAELWHGISQTVEYRDDRDALVRGFVLATSELSHDDLQEVLEVAYAAAKMKRGPRK